MCVCVCVCVHAEELDTRCDGLSLHNTTLLVDKKELEDTIKRMRSAAVSGDGDTSGLERELRELQSNLHQKVSSYITYCITVCSSMWCLAFGIVHSMLAHCEEVASIL